MQVEYPLDENVPAKHKIVLLEQEAAPDMDTFPVAQFEQLKEPIKDANVPATHSEQLVAPSPDAYAPTGQVEQIEADAAE